ncbi:Phosphoribosyl-AMP cyclohydrolase / Phosphoribosyl-ATP pyrophosphatase [hydrothermal vent metagenome]|uniref:Phosphoribosyl-AMP cyclohydrolase / Phosphoribosyl-ATP pyrophosphatase n=1 Tax=hydrothermal vent metagenome TaxID=652676 RepID=A0A3B0S2Z9_9ZZZZ
MTKSTCLQNLDWQKGDGLIPAIVQHASSGEVLMLGYMNAPALDATLQSNKVTFFSRSRNTLWQKGETSGNILELVDISTDCDRDSLLVLAQPSGPTCHTGSRSCFAEAPAQDFSWLYQLQQIIDSRATDDPTQSYTAKLLQGPLERAAQKVGEEGVEVALAALHKNPEQLPEEAADLLFHLLVLLRAKRQNLGDVIGVLRSRHQP